VHAAVVEEVRLCNVRAAAKQENTLPPIETEQHRNELLPAKLEVFAYLLNRLEP